MYKLLLTVALVLIFSISAMASETRVLTMGDNNNVLLDDANIWMYPGRTLEYPNLAIGQFDGDGFSKFGITWQFNEDNPWVLGTYFSTDEPFTDGGFVPIDFNIMDNQRIDLLYGRSLSSYNFGLAFSLFNSSIEAGAYNESFTFADFTFGLSETSGKWDVAVNFGFGDWTDETVTGEVETDKDGYFNFGINGRYFMSNGPNYTFIPHIAISTEKKGMNWYGLNGDYADIDLNEKFTGTSFEAGFGMNYTPSNAVLAVCDFGIMYSKDKTESDDNTSVTEMEDKTTTLPYFKIGLDADVFKWMDIRFGATSFWNTDDNEVTKNSYADNATYLGFGFHWGDLTIDTYTDPGMFLDGFNFLSGADNDMNFRFSATYSM